MKKVIFACRFQCDSSDPMLEEIEDDLDIRSVTESNFDRDKERQKIINKKQLFEYEYLLFDLEDISSANSVDKNHTNIVLVSDRSYVIRTSFDKFADIYSGLLGITIHDFFSLKANTKLVNESK